MKGPSYSLNRVSVSPHYSLHEFESPDTREVMVHPIFLAYLEVLIGIREGKDFTQTSAYRTPGHNRSQGGEDTSSHLIGEGGDLVPDDGDIDRLERDCKRAGFPVVVNEGDHIHCGLRRSRDLA